jgi:hypothetical protein
MARIPGSYSVFKSMSLSILVLASAFAPEGDACPSGIFIDELHPRPTAVRSSLRLFVWHKSAAEEIPIQIDPVDDDGHIIFFEDELWREQALKKTDLVSLRSEAFGRKMDYKKDRLPCHGAATFQLQDPETGKFGYLTSCNEFAANPFGVFPILFDEAVPKIQSFKYLYRFNRANFMQFEEIAFAKAGDGPLGTEWEKVASNSELLIRADVKNFFNMNFDSDEIESELENKRLGPVGHMARLTFYLRVLIFKIRMSLSTDVGFYEDSGHIPMMVTLPVNAYDYLHPASGILYSWEPSALTSQSLKTINMPRLDPVEVKKGYVNLAKNGKKYCKGSVCGYSYTVNLTDRRLSMDFRIPRSIVEKGFFPHYVENVEKFREQMGWKLDKKKAQSRIGIYFEVTGLPEGGHPWDFWLRLGDVAKEAKFLCPHTLKISKVPSGALR